MTTRTRPILLLSAAMLVASAASPAHAMSHPATATPCPMRISELSWRGRPLSYETVAHAGDSYTSVSGTGTVFTTALMLADGRQAHLAVEKNGCARVISDRAYFAEPLRRARGGGLR